MSLEDKFWADYEQNSAQPTRWKDQNKAGIIPYFREPDGTVKFLMMVASDPKFGGFRPMISKGTIEPGETVLGCALRETQEELGLKDSNICSPAITVFDEYVVLKSVEYHLTIFAVEVMSKHDFDMPGSETKFTTWMTAESFMDRGRRDHQPILQKLVDILNES